MYGFKSLIAGEGIKTEKNAMNSKFNIVKNIVMMFFCLILGCVVGVREHGRKFNVSAVNQIEVGKTSEAEVIALLGEPKDKTLLKSGAKVYGYFYGERRTKDYFFVEKKEWTGAVVTIVFDEKGIVSSVSSSSLPEVNSVLWRPPPPPVLANP